MDKLNINITKEDVDKHLKQAILESTLASSIQVAIGKCLTGYSLDRLMERAVEDQVANIIKKMVQEDEAKIRTMIRENLTDDLIDQFVSNALYRMREE